MRAIVRGFSLAAAFLFASTTFPGVQAGDVKKDDKLWVYIGTYTQGKSEGIYRFELDLGTGKASKAVLAAKIKDPSFLAIHPNRKFLYAVGEFPGK